MWCVCHSVWFFCLKCLCVLLAVYCDVVRFVICLRVLLCVCVCVHGCFVCLCDLFENDRVVLYGVFICGGRFYCKCCSC